MKHITFFPTLILQNLVSILHFWDILTCTSHMRRFSSPMFLLLWMQQRPGVGGGLASAQVDELGGPRVPGKGW